MSFAGWLIMNRLQTVPEATALHVLWHDGNDAGAIKRAVKIQRIRRGRGASWTKCAGESGRDILGRTVA